MRLSQIIRVLLASILLFNSQTSCSTIAKGVNTDVVNNSYIHLPEREGYFLSSKDFNKANSIYLIDKDYIIPKGKEIIIAENSVLVFDGGSIAGEGLLNFNRAELNGLPRVFSKIKGTLSGYVYPEWFKSSSNNWDEVFNLICSLQCEVRLKSNAIYTLTRPLYIGYSCMIKGGTNSTLHFNRCATCIYVGHSNKLQDFNIAITNPQDKPVALEINTEHLGKTMVNGTGSTLPFSFWWGSMLNIIIERVNIDFNGISNAFKGYGFRFLANKVGQNGWNIKVSDCVICGYFEYAFHVSSDDSMIENPKNQTAWFTDVYFYNNRIARAKNGFYFGRRNSPGCLAPEKVLISGCSMQGGDGERHPYFVNADCVNNLAIRDCIAWDWTANGGKAYRFTSECKAIDVWDANITGYMYEGDHAVVDSQVNFKSNSKKQLKKGPTEFRPEPSLYNDGDVYFDTSLKKPLWKYGDKWYDANGKAY